MAKEITKQQILDLIKDKKFISEDEFRDYLTPKLTKLFKIKETQIDKESNTTSFDYTLSNRADIIIKTEDQFKKAIIVIEIKLAKSINNYKNGNYEDPRKQLFKYCQDTRAPYGILLTDETCFIYENKYFSYDQKPKRIPTNTIPSVTKIEDKMAFYALLDFIFYKKSIKYICLSVFLMYLLSTTSNTLFQTFGFWVCLLSTTIVIFTAMFVIAALLIFNKILE